MLSRDCRRCGKSRVVSRREAEAIFRGDTDTREALDRNPDCDGVCTWCCTEAESE
jgi:hypothetical protein